MPAAKVFLDANVLYPAELRNLLMHLAVVGAYSARWSADVHEEWIRSLLKNRPDLTRSKLDRTRELMERAAPDALVTDYDGLIASLVLPDADDRHVLAAAIRGEANLIVTRNVTDFPCQTLEAFRIQAKHPDDFILELLELVPAAVIEASENHRASLIRPPRALPEYLDSLERQGLSKAIAALRRLTVFS